MFGLKERTSDLDLCVSMELFEQLKDKYEIKEEDKNSCGFYRINNLVEVISNEKSNFTMEEIDGYQVEELKRILEFKKSRNLPKDQKDIENIESYLASRKN